jgi:acetaldehyde dehydrogenase
MTRTKVAVIGSSNIWTDHMFKVLRLSDTLEMSAVVGIDPESDGLARGVRHGMPIASDGVDGLIAMPDFDDIGIVFDATSAKAHKANASVNLDEHVDKANASVNLDEHVDKDNANMVTCGGQATIPVVAIAQVTPVPYAEIVASIASRSASPGTRANIDEFTETTSAAIEAVGGARRGKAVIVLNPAEPPLIMRDTVLALIGDADHDEIRASIEQMVARVAAYVPGYRLRQEFQILPIPPDQPVHTLVPEGSPAVTHQVTVFLEVEGATHYLPAYAGNLDIALDMVAARSA